MKFTVELACNYIERHAEGESATLEQEVEAWAYLIKTAQVWSLPTRYGKRAIALIESQLISEEGDIDWNVFKECDYVRV